MVLFKLELKKSLHNKAFLMSIVIATVFVVLSLIYCVSIYNRDMSGIRDVSNNTDVIYAPGMPIYTLFNHWIGGESGSLGTSVFFFIFPILCALPYGWSYCVEKNSGYRRTIIVQTGKKNYYAAKYFATFISGGLAVVIPMILSLIMTAAYFPAIKPDVIYDIYYGVFKYSLMSKLFYTEPFLYIALYFCIIFMFCGALACCSMAATAIIKQKYIVMLVPFVLCLAIHFIVMFTYDSNSLYNKEMSLFYFLHPSGTRYPASFEIIGVTFFTILIITVAITNIWERRHEIY